MSEAVQEIFIITERLHSPSAAKTIQILLKFVGAGDSPVRGNARAADKRVPESGGFPRLPEGSAASQTPYDDAEF